MAYKYVTSRFTYARERIRQHQGRYTYRIQRNLACADAYLPVPAINRFSLPVRRHFCGVYQARKDPQTAAKLCSIGRAFLFKRRGGSR